MAFISFFFFFCGGGVVAKSYLTRVTPWTIACQAPLSMGFSKQEYWSGLPFPSPWPSFLYHFPPSQFLLSMIKPLNSFLFLMSFCCEPLFMLFMPHVHDPPKAHFKYYFFHEVFPVLLGKMNPSPMRIACVLSVPFLCCITFSIIFHKIIILLDNILVTIF